MLFQKHLLLFNVFLISFNFCLLPCADLEGGGGLDPSWKVQFLKKIYIVKLLYGKYYFISPPPPPCKKFPNPQMLTMCFLRYYIHASDYVSYKILQNMMMWHFDILNAVLCMVLIRFAVHVTELFYLSFHTKVFPCIHMYKFRRQILTNS